MGIVRVAEMKHVYAMLRSDGLVKVGISDNPRSRRSSVASMSGQAVTVEHATGLRSDALGVESIAHRLLKAKHHQGEWFSVSKEDHQTLLPPSGFPVVTETCLKIPNASTFPCQMTS